MKKSVMIAISAAMLISLQAQEAKRFNYVESEYGSYLVTPMLSSQRSKEAEVRLPGPMIII
jgi:hypothetical protein